MLYMPPSRPPYYLFIFSDKYTRHIRLGAREIVIGEQHKPEAKATSILCFICNLVHLEYNSEGARKPLFYLIVLPYIYNCELKIAILKIALNTFL